MLFKKGDHRSEKGLVEVRVGGLADLFRRIWSIGSAGVEVPLTLVREGVVSRIQVRSADRQDLLKKPALH